MTVPVTFERSLSGVMGTFLQLLDVDEVWTGMTQFGNWTPTSMSTPKPVPFVCLIQVPTYDKVLTKVDAYSGHTAGLSALSMINIHEVQLNIPMVFNPASRQDRMHLWQSDAMGWRAIGLTLCASAGDRALRHFIPRSPKEQPRLEKRVLLNVRHVCQDVGNRSTRLCCRYIRNGKG